MRAAAKVAQCHTLTCILPPLPKEMVAVAEEVAVAASFGLTGRAVTQLLLPGIL